MRIALVLAENESARPSLRTALRKKGSVVSEYSDAWALMRAIRSCAFNILIVDPHMSGVDGATLVSVLRHILNLPYPVLMVGDEDDETSIVECLDAGADGFVSKFASRKLLQVMIPAIVKRAAFDILNENVFCNPVNLTLEVNDRAIKVSAREFKLALILFSNIGCNLSRHSLGQNDYSEKQRGSRILDLDISRLRQHLNQLVENRFEIVHIYKRGYRLEDRHTGGQERKRLFL